MEALHDAGCLEKGNVPLSRIGRDSSAAALRRSASTLSSFIPLRTTSTLFLVFFSCAAIMNTRSLLRLGQVVRRSPLQPRLLRSFSSSVPSLSSSSSSPPRTWTPTPFVTETVVCMPVKVCSIYTNLLYREVAGTPVCSRCYDGGEQY